MSQIIYFVGQFRPKGSCSEHWEFQGVFDTEQAASDACLNVNYFYVGIELNVPLPDKQTAIVPTFPKRGMEQ